MADYPDDTRQSDETTLFSREQLRVQLPGTRPVVILPTTSSPNFTRPFPAESDHAAAAEPSVESLDNHLPYLGAPAAQQSAANSIENQMRGMILRNGIPQGQIMHQPNSRPNQAQRGQQTFHLNNAPSSNPSFNVQAQRQLYNPNAGQGRREEHLQRYNPIVSVQEQIAYLDTLAIREIPKIEISREEYDYNQALRLSLEATCRKVVAAYELEKDNSFMADTVELKCFGSLSTTFATKFSDMDLVLVSPQSKPALSSPESEIPRLVEKALLECGYGARYLDRSYVPIVKVCESPTPNDANTLKQLRRRWETEMNASATRAKADAKPSNEKTDSGSSEPAKTQHLANSVHAEGEETSRGVSMPATDIKESTPQSGSGSRSNGSNGEGSSSGLMGKQGDDITLLDRSDEELIGLYKLAIRHGSYSPSERDVINTFIKATQDRTIPKQDKIMARSQLQSLPNIIGRYPMPRKALRLEMPKGGVGVQCDISFGNELALQNSHLLRCYSLCDHRVRKLVLVVKAWAKSRDINTPYHGTLSSYGYVLMVLHYLVNIAKPTLLPNLQVVSQAFEDELSMKEAVLDGHNIRFFRNETAIEDLRRANFFKRNKESVGSLLRGFFHYYAEVGGDSPAGGFRWAEDTLSLRSAGGILTKQSKGWTTARTETVDIPGPEPVEKKQNRHRYLLAIEDPFETQHNVARTVGPRGMDAIREEFKCAHRLVQTGGREPGRWKAVALFNAPVKKSLLGPAPPTKTKMLLGPAPEPKGYW